MDLYNLNIYSITLRLFLALFIAGTIGYEREQRQQNAGMRTYMLIGLGACLAMITNQFIYESFPRANEINRMGAQVIQGVGFLGIGTIMVVGRQRVKGLTTAAGMWATACIGLACGIGFYQGAIISGFIMILTIVSFQRIDDKIKANLKNVQLFTIIKGEENLELMYEYFRINNIDIKLIDISFENHNYEINLGVDVSGQFQYLRIIDDLSKIPGMATVRKS